MGSGAGYPNRVHPVAAAACLTPVTQQRYATPAHFSLPSAASADLRTTKPSCA